MVIEFPHERSRALVCIALGVIVALGLTQTVLPADVVTNIPSNPEIAGLSAVLYLFFSAIAAVLIAAGVKVITMAKHLELAPDRMHLVEGWDSRSEHSYDDVTHFIAVPADDAPQEVGAWQLRFRDGRVFTADAWFPNRTAGFEMLKDRLSLAPERRSSDLLRS